MNLSECSYPETSTDPGPSVASHGLCVCCLELRGPFVNLGRCSHLEILKNLCIGDFNVDCKLSDMLVCLQCHRMLDRIYLFRQQVQESLLSLTCQVKLLTSTRKIYLLQQTNTNTSYYCDTEITEPTLHVDVPILNTVEMMKQEPEEIKYYITDDEMMNNNELVKEEYNSDDNLSQLKDIIQKVKKKEKKIKNKKIKKIPKNNEINVQNTLSDIEYRNIVPNEDHITIKPEASEWNKEHITTTMTRNTKGGINSVKYEDKIELIRLSHEQVVLERENKMLKPEYTDKPYKCRDCIKGFVVENELEAHNNKWHNTKDQCYQCELCKRKLKRGSTFYSHHNRHYDRYECVICKQRYSTLNQATQHYNKAHGSLGELISDGTTCQECGLVFISSRRYRYHYDTHHRTWQCNECNKIISSRAALITHIRNVHNTASHTCKECGKTFNTLAYLAAHSSIHRERKRKQPDETRYCVQCDKVFSTSAALGFHLKTNLKHVTDNRFECKECSSKFVDKKGLRQHIDLIHLNIRRHSCQVCDKAFKTNESLRRHRNDIHLKLPRKPKDKICHICGHGFDANRHLTIHMRRHTGERPLSCDMCNATFAHPAALYNHRKLRHKVLPKKTLQGRVRIDCRVPQIS